jgi:hypothetical protein
MAEHSQHSHADSDVNCDVIWMAEYGYQVLRREIAYERRSKSRPPPHLVQGQPKISRGDEQGSTPLRDVCFRGTPEACTQWNCMQGCDGQFMWRGGASGKHIAFLGDYRWEAFNTETEMSRANYRQWIQ